MKVNFHVIHYVHDYFIKRRYMHYEEQNYSFILLYPQYIILYIVHPYNVYGLLILFEKKKMSAIIINGLNGKIAVVIFFIRVQFLIFFTFTSIVFDFFLLSFSFD